MKMSKGQMGARLLGLAVGGVALAASGWDDRQAWMVLSEVVVEQLGVKPEQVTRDARFIQDLGAD